MSALLTDHLALLTTAPNGIKRLRGLILELAVRGKLVPQDPSDEPASELLKRVEAEKARLVKEGKVRKPRVVAAVGEDERPFEVPDGWEWVRLGDAIRKLTDGTHHSPPNGSSGPYKYISAKNIKPWGVDLKGVTYVTQEVHDEIYSRCNPETGDVLYIKDGATTGVVTLNTLDEPFSMLSSVALLKPSVGLSGPYLVKVMSSPFFYDEVRAGMTGIAITRVTLSRLATTLVPLPPLPEQHRIVARVDELMALCDRLEAEQTDAAEAHTRLVQALLATLTESRDAAELTANWQRLAAHFHTLFTTEASIDALKQTILQLAVMGRLVPQDPSDEPASELLKRIEAEKARLVKEGKIRKPKTVEPVGEGERPFEVPTGWNWVKLGTAVELINGDRSKNYPNREEYVSSGVPWINTGHIEPNGTLSETSMHFITREKLNSLRSGKIEPSDLVYCLRGATFGKTAFVTPYSEGAVASSLVIIRAYLPSLARYLYLYLISPLGRTQIFRFDNGSAQPNLSANSVTLFALPLPPLPEQHRIVAKVDELMALCDRLKADLHQARASETRIADALTTIGQKP